jgi:hypothetical protein
MKRRTSHHSDSGPHRVAAAAPRIVGKLTRGVALFCRAIEYNGSWRLHGEPGRASWSTAKPKGERPRLIANRRDRILTLY